MYAASVTSERAMNATGDRWAAGVASLAPNGLECPPDAVVRLSFSHIVDVDLIASSLLLNGANSDATIAVSACTTTATVGGEYVHVASVCICCHLRCASLVCPPGHGVRDGSTE